MKYFILIWAGLWRKKVRTILTMLSAVFAFLLFGLLQGINKGFDTAVENLNASRLYTANKYSMVEGMPISLARQIAAVPGVTGVTHWTYFGGYYQDRRNAIPAFATDAVEMFKLYKEVDMPPEVMEKMQRTRNGALVGKPVADQYGWKVGDVVPIGTSIWTKKDGRTDYQFEIVGIYDSEELASTNVVNGFYINFDYFDEVRAIGNGRVHYFISGISDPRMGPEVSKAIDALFANSPDETKTQSEQALAASQIKQLADINFIVNSIVGAVLFTLLFLTGNTMMQSVRERIPELAILKTVGFSNAKVSTFVLLESILMCVVAAVIGLAISSLILPVFQQVLGLVTLSWEVIVSGVVAAVVLACISGAPPAWRAQHLNIVDALAAQ